jgi:hypothetical protein
MFSRRVVTALIAIPTAAILIACGSGSKDNSPQEGPGAQKQSTPASAPTAKPKYKHTIVMEITGPAKADITYLLGSDTSQDNGAKLPDLLHRVHCRGVIPPAHIGRDLWKTQPQLLAH